MGFVPKWSRGDHKKTAPSHAQHGVRQMPSLFHGAKDAQFSAPNLFADGGEVSEDVLKAEGIKASENDGSVWDRLKAGNIDDPSSEAYRRYGAGRGRQERDMAMAEKQMDQLDSMKRENEANRQMDQLEALKQSSAAAAAERELVAREDSRDAEMNRLMKAAKPVVARRPAAAPAAKASAPVNYATAENESAAETARLVEASRRAAERKEVPRVGMVKPRPRMNWSTPADRARWDEKYKATHNEDGTPK